MAFDPPWALGVGEEAAAGVEVAGDGALISPVCGLVDGVAGVADGRASSFSLRRLLDEVGSDCCGRLEVSSLAGLTA